LVLAKPTRQKWVQPWPYECHSQSIRPSPSSWMEVTSCKYFPLAASAPDTVNIQKCIDNNNLFKVLEHNFFVYKSLHSEYLSHFWNHSSFQFLDIEGLVSFVNCHLHQKYPQPLWITKSLSNTEQREKNYTYFRQSKKCKNIAASVIKYVVSDTHPRTPGSWKIKSILSMYIVFFQVWKNVRRLEITYRATALVNHLYLQLWGCEITLCPATGYHIIQQMMS
jgi:hypothetical protein